MRSDELNDKINAVLREWESAHMVKIDSVTTSKDSNGTTTAYASYTPASLCFMCSRPMTRVFNNTPGVKSAYPKPELAYCANADCAYYQVVKFIPLPKPEDEDEV